jgi:hypothetical protein
LAEGVSGFLFEVGEQGVVAGVVVVDDLEGPAVVDDVAADEVAFEFGGELLVAGVAEELQDFVELVVGAAGEFVEAVEVAAGAIDCFEGVGEAADGQDGLVVDTFRSRPGGCLCVVAHEYAVPRPIG